jgi:hypothetical protein
MGGETALSCTRDRHPRGRLTSCARDAYLRKLVGCCFRRKRRGIVVVALDAATADRLDVKHNVRTLLPGDIRRGSFADS